jgi:hypothetical protein
MEMPDEHVNCDHRDQSKHCKAISEDRRLIKFHCRTDSFLIHQEFVLDQANMKLHHAMQNNTDPDAIRPDQLNSDHGAHSPSIPPGLDFITSVKAPAHAGSSFAQSVSAVLSLLRQPAFVGGSFSPASPLLVTTITFFLGIIREYAGRVYEKAKARPHYMGRKVVRQRASQWESTGSVRLFA